MASPNSPLALSGIVQDYAWGGFDFIADLTGQKKEENLPWAELWLGAHPKGPALTTAGSLDEVIAARPAEVLSPAIAQDYDNTLPFLFKVLDVRQMLSIQAHPTKSVAEAGFLREEAAGIARTAPNRSYRDRNHKPELGVALTDFYLLHGFRSVAAIKASLLAETAWQGLLPILEQSGIKGLYQTVMEASQEQVNTWLKPLAERLLPQTELSKTQAGFWARRAFQQYSRAGDHDRGVFSIYWFNLVKLSPGQGIFQAAGIPHAYLEGCCIELMANSDNVLRGGLTVKHIDVPELMEQLDFSPVEPQLLELTNGESSWQSYDTPAPDFNLAFAALNPGKQTKLPAGPAILLLLEGEITIGELRLTSGEACWLPYGHNGKISASKKSQLYLARVGG
ncbi:MAG: mannose-6-phosphate isomerase, class I [Bacteroidota bacterium]